MQGSSCPDGHGLGRNLVVLIWTQILLSDFLNAQATPGLVLPQERTTGLGCIPEGRTVSYQCTVADTTNPLVGSTIWSGSAFHDQCPSSSNRINIPHIQFSEMRTFSCGTLMGRAVEVDGSNFVSQLNLTASIELKGSTLLCSLGGLSSVGMDNISVGVIPPPPGSLMVTLTSGSILIVSWSQPSAPVEGGLAGYVFGVTGEGCGCESMSITADTTCMTCSGWTAAGQTCSFEVRTLSQDCGFSSSPASEELTACDSAELGGSPSSMSSSGTADTSNGRVIYNGVVVGSVANLICNDGYIPKEIDSSNRSCMSNGKWSGSTQTCIALSQSQQNLGLIALILLLLPLLLSAISFIIGFNKGQLYNPSWQTTETRRIVGLSILTLGGFYFGMRSSKSDVGSKIWKKKRLKVYFMNPEDITKVKCRGESMSINTILAWARVWNLVPFPQIPLFEWTEDKEEADIRVNFKLSGSEEKAVNCSIVGSNHEVISILSAPTMELDLSQSSPHLQESIVIREFGHALGLENEQQRGDFWDAVEGHLDTDQMKEDRGGFDFKHNLSRKNIPWELSVNYLTDYDPQSIMHCLFDVKWITTLPTRIDESESDVKKKEYLQSIAEKCIKGTLPRQPSDKDYGRLIKAYGEYPALPNMVPSTETLQQAIQKARNYDRLQSEIWNGKKTLNVYFMYSDKIKDWGWKCRGQLIDINSILAWARVWNIPSYPKIPTFEMTAKAEEADIQIQFIGGGHMQGAVPTPSTVAGGIWSKLWMQVTTTSTDPKKMTVCLNLAGLEEQPELQESIVIKQFGHALGLKNEHQRSDFWNVIRKYLNVGKMKENPEIESAFEDQWAATSEEQTVNSLSEYDPESITHFKFDMEWMNIKFEESGTIDPKKHPLLSETEIKLLNGLSKRSQFGDHELPKRPSISDYEKLQAAYEAWGTSS